MASCIGKLFFFVASDQNMMGISSKSVFAEKLREVNGLIQYYFKDPGAETSARQALLFSDLDLTMNYCQNFIS